MTVFMLGLMSGLLFWPVIGSAELYKWTDDQGNLHITDTPSPMTQKKSATTVAPIPRSSSQKKATARPILPRQSHAEVHPVPGPPDPPASEKVLTQRSQEGLSPSQATLTSSWQVFDGNQPNAKAPVQRWKDEAGLDHFADVLPIARGDMQVGAKPEDVSVSHSTRRAKERTSGASRLRYQVTE